MKNFTAQIKHKYLNKNYYQLKIIVKFVKNIYKITYLYYPKHVLNSDACSKKKKYKKTMLWPYKKVCKRGPEKKIKKKENCY